MIIADLWSSQIESISSSKSNIAYIYLACLRFLEMKSSLLCFATNCIVNVCSLKTSVVGLPGLLKLEFVPAISVLFLERSKLGNIVTISYHLKSQLSHLSFSTIYLQSSHGRYVYLSLENHCAVMFYTKNQDDLVLFLCAD